MRGNQFKNVRTNRCWWSSIPKIIRRDPLTTAIVSRPIKLIGYDLAEQRMIRFRNLNIDSSLISDIRIVR